MERILFSDDFSSGLEGWDFSRFGSFVCDDGIITKDNGLHVVPKGVNASTGEPAFSLSLPGVMDHIKWAMNARSNSSTGFPGFETPSSGSLVMKCTLGGSVYGVSSHPFGSAVRNPSADFRLASIAMVNMDPESNVVLDFFLTEKLIYAVYERTPLGREKLGNYASFSYAVPVQERSNGDVHELEIVYSASLNSASWRVDGREVYSVTGLGRRIEEKYMFIDAGGEEMEVRPRQFTSGLGLFSILDGSLAGGPALVNIAGGSDLNSASDYVDSEGLEKNKLFGQGAELVCQRFTVSSV